MNETLLLAPLLKTTATGLFPSCSSGDLSCFLAIRSVASITRIGMSDVEWF